MGIFNFFNKSGPSGHDPILAAVRDDDIGAVKQHLANGQQVNSKTERGMTPLHIAALGGDKEIAELLITKGADVNPFWVIPMLGTHKPEMATPRKPSD